MASKRSGSVLVKVLVAGSFAGVLSLQLGTAASKVYASYQSIRSASPSAATAAPGVQTVAVGRLGRR